MQNQDQSAKMRSVPVLPERLDWHSAIGNFILNHGMIEYLVFVILKDNIAPAEFEKVKQWHFKDRLDRITRYLSDTKCSQEQQNYFKILVNRLDAVRDLRNHIAHGHLHLQLDPKTGNPTITIFKAKDLDAEQSPESKHLEFHQLRSALTTLSELIEELQNVAGFSTHETHHF